MLIFLYCSIWKKRLCIFNCHVKSFRRNEALRYAFAAAVAKRLFSERMTSTNKTSIIEHHRSVGWAEKEYINLMNVVQANASLLHNFLGNNPPKDWEKNYLFEDYSKMLHPAAYVQNRDAVSNMRWDI